MDWVFFSFAVATIGYTLFIAKEFIADSNIQKSLLEILVEERFTLVQKIEAQTEETTAVSEQIKKGKETVKELQDVINNQNIEIRKFEEGMEKRGKFRVE